MSFFLKIKFGREPTPTEALPVAEKDNSDCEKNFTSKMQEAVIVLIKQSWAQYENVCFKLPERYFNKIKNYLWLVTLIVGAKIKIAIDLYVAVMRISDAMLKDFIVYAFIFSSLLEIGIFLFCIIALNTKHDIVLALDTPYSFLRSYSQHSYELLYNLLHQIEEGIRTCKERISKQSFHLGCIGWAVFVDLLLIMIIATCCFKILQES